jgi:hypothetical protein
MQIRCLPERTVRQSPSWQLAALLGFQDFFMGCQMRLKLNANTAQSMIRKNATPSPETGQQLVALLGFQGFMGCQMRLKLNVNKAQSMMIQEDATPATHGVLICFPLAAEKSTLRPTCEVIHQNVVSWGKVVLMQHSLAVSYNAAFLSWCGCAFLLSQLAGSAPPEFSQLAGCSVLEVASSCTEWQV